MVLGINRRNAIIARENPRAALRLVKDKEATKRVLEQAGVPAPPTLAHLATPGDVAAMRWSELPSTWVMKPCRGSRGRGVLVAIEPPAPTVCIAHATAILDGEFSDGVDDTVLVEPLLRSHDDLDGLAPAGLPDVRVVTWRGHARLAMLRLPTRASGGRGNLHQGGIGAAIDVDSGVITRAVLAGQPVDDHPDTGSPIVGRRVPLWRDVCASGLAAARATGLGYAGIDLVIDRDLGVLVLEVNGHPGLEIQNVCGSPLIPPDYGRRP